MNNSRAKNAAQTPDLGVNFDSSSAFKAPQIKNTESAKPLGWHKTIIKHDKNIVSQWSAESQGRFFLNAPHGPHRCQFCLIAYQKEWGAVALGSLDLSLRTVSVSPSNLTADAGYIHSRTTYRGVKSDSIALVVS